MQRFDNPFHDLWITEILDPAEFVKMFSPKVALHAESLFATGNVVVRGRQGSGKSMLLGLLNTRTRVAYARSGQPYPAPQGYKPFIAAGINLTRDNARIVASRLSERPDSQRKDWAANTFADYVNYVLVQDLLQNVLYLEQEQRKDGVLEEELRIDRGADKQGSFIRALVASDAWEGYLDGCESIEKIVQRVEMRLAAYRRYFNFNVESLEPNVENSKTDIGEPIAVLADCLREFRVIPQESLVHLRIDQHEELYELEKSSGYGDIFRQVVNRALATRDGRVAYRVGTRHYAWSEQISVWGSGAQLEDMRDYSIVDIDQILKKHESPAIQWPFPDFAEDVFRRRLQAAGFQVEFEPEKSVLSMVFGDSLRPKDRARLYAKDGPARLDIPVEWAPEWRKALEDLWKDEPLHAKLGEAWLRQDAQQENRLFENGEAAAVRPWLEREYWVKERNEVALMQIAGDARQTLIWSGREDLIQLSGWSILAFMSICRSVWAAWLRKTSDQELQKTRLPSIGKDEQVIGVHEASRAWYDKLKESTDGDRRTRFISNLGAWFAARLRSDRALSNPGHNGFSLLQTDFDEKIPIANLIRTCRDHGDLIESSHTTKNKDAKPRLKWYLNPILCPNFRIPHIRTKEPIYSSLAEIQKVFEGDLPTGKDGATGLDDSDPAQSSLF